MNRPYKRFTALILVFTLLSCVFAVPISAEQTSAGSFLPYKGVYYYRPVLGEFDASPDDEDQYVYSDGFFTGDSGIYNEHLATFSMIVSECSVGSNREPDTAEGYKNKSRNAAALLEDNGFTDIDTNDDYKSKPGNDTIGVLCAHKTVTVSDNDYTLIAVIPRSADYEKEWISNFTLGADGDAEGFDKSADKCLSYVRDYIRRTGISGDIKLWTAGFSRGGGVAELIAKKLINDPKGHLGESVELYSGDLYAYCFAVPKVADSGNDPRNSKYASIFNISANTELPSKIPPTNMGFDRYGTDISLAEGKDYDTMLSKLNIRSKYIHDLYKDSYSSRLFKPKKLVINGDSVSIVDDDESYIPNDVSTYLDGLATYLTYVSGGREGYHAEFEKPVSYLIGYLGTLNTDQMSAFVDSLTNNEDTPYAALAMYAYFMRYKAKYGNLTFRKGADAELADTAADIGEDAETSADAGLIAKLTLRLAVYMLRSPESLKDTAADYLGSVLGKAMDATGATTEERSVLLSKSSLKTLTHFLSFMLLGNIWQSSRTDYINIENEQIKNAATLIGNAINIVSDHANEILVSWMKTDDSYYDDYKELTAEEATGYRRVYISAPKSVRLDGEITTDGGDTVAVIEDGKPISSSDLRVGYTTSDNGGFFRIPADIGYRIKLKCSGSCDVSVRIGEYTCYDAKCVTVSDKTVSATPRDTVTVKLPRLFGDFTVPSGAKYNTYIEESTDTILGDADSNGEVDTVDAVAVSRTVLHLPCAVFDKLAADVDSDGDITIVDATFIQRAAINVPVPYPIGKRIGSTE